MQTLVDTVHLHYVLINIFMYEYRITIQHSIHCSIIIRDYYKRCFDSHVFGQSTIEITKWLQNTTFIIRKKICVQSSRLMQTSPSAEKVVEMMHIEGNM